jgi:hypothetical protein
LRGQFGKTVNRNQGLWKLLAFSHQLETDEVMLLNPLSLEGED